MSPCLTITKSSGPVCLSASFTGTRGPTERPFDTRTDSDGSRTGRTSVMGARSRRSARQAAGESRPSCVAWRSGPVRSARTRGTDDSERRPGGVPNAVRPPQPTTPNLTCASSPDAKADVSPQLSQPRSILITPAEANPRPVFLRGEEPSPCLEEDLKNIRKFSWSLESRRCVPQQWTQESERVQPGKRSFFFFLLHSMILIVRSSGPVSSLGPFELVEPIQSTTLTHDNHNHVSISCTPRAPLVHTDASTRSRSSHMTRPMERSRDSKKRVDCDRASITASRSAGAHSVPPSLAYHPPSLSLSTNISRSRSSSPSPVPFNFKDATPPPTVLSPLTEAEKPRVKPHLSLGLRNLPDLDTKSNNGYFHRIC